MKKTLKRIMTLTLALTLVVSSCCLTTFAAETTQGIAITEENFPDENLRDFLLNGSYSVWDENNNEIEIVYDANKDGYLSESEIANIRHLLIQETNITDLTGIEYLTALVEIGCQYSAVETMNLTNNKELVYLLCSKANITGELDLSENTKLFMVSCQRNPLLTSVDISGCKDLYFINLTATGVSEIDISNNPELSGIAFDCTSVSSIDTSNNEKLTSISAYNSQLTSLDVSNNPELDYLDVSGCLLSGLDVSTNTVLKYLNVKNNPLAWLNIGDNENLEAYISDSTVSLQVSDDSFDITKAFDGIDADKVTIVSGAEKNGNIISSYSYDTPIVYTYDCGTDANGAVTLTVTLNLTK